MNFVEPESHQSVSMHDLTLRICTLPEKKKKIIKFLTVARWC